MLMAARDRKTALFVGIDECQRLARAGNHERVRVQTLHFLARIEHEPSHASEKSTLSILVNFKPATTGILSEDATHILHWPAPHADDSAAPICPKR